MTDEYSIEETSDAIFKVDKKGGNTYTVDTEERTCTCLAYKYSKKKWGRKMCKHLMIVEGLK